MMNPTVSNFTILRFGVPHCLRNSRLWSIRFQRSQLQSSLFRACWTQNCQFQGSRLRSCEFLIFKFSVLKPCRFRVPNCNRNVRVPRLTNFLLGSSQFQSSLDVWVPNSRVLSFRVPSSRVLDSGIPGFRILNIEGTNFRILDFKVPNCRVPDSTIPVSEFSVPPFYKYSI